jgi:tripartite-type tricarboxylate transporter receptor subunit TctC
VRRKLAPLGGYPRAMSPEETVAFVEAEQKRWQPILDQIAQQPQ